MPIGIPSDVKLRRRFATMTAEHWLLVRDGSKLLTNQAMFAAAIADRSKALRRRSSLQCRVSDLQIGHLHPLFSVTVAGGSAAWEQGIEAGENVLV